MAVRPATDEAPDEAPHEAPDVLLRLLDHARTQPTSPALKDDEMSVTWAELIAWVENGACTLADSGVSAGDRVMIRLPNSAQFVAAALSCLWLGAAFVPASVDDPPERVRQQIDDCQPSVVVIAGTDDGAGALAGCDLLDVGLLSKASRVSPPSPPPSPPPPCSAAGRDAYLIYTSGTTGRPKGVRISVEAFGWAVATTAKRFGLTPATRSLSVSAFHFDGSYATLFPTLYAGGCSVIPRREQLLFGKRFFNAVREEQISHTSFSPTYLRLLLHNPRFASLADSQLTTLALGGEELKSADLIRVWEVVPDLRIFNIYGPTETTIQVTSFDIPKSSLVDRRVPLGQPHEGVDFELVGGDGRPVDTLSARGELWIGGRQLMSGYWSDRALTDRVLREDVIAGRPFYRTGDLVERDEAGLYYYLGRVDDVVKRRGVRISLTELAHVLESIDGVEAAVCRAVETDGVLSITAWVQSATDDSQPILEAARKQLPATMLPDQMVLKRQFPMTPAGKIDRSALAER